MCIWIMRENTVCLSDTEPARILGLTQLVSTAPATHSQYTDTYDHAKPHTNMVGLDVSTQHLAACPSLLENSLISDSLLAHQPRQAYVVSNTASDNVHRSNHQKLDKFICALCCYEFTRRLSVKSHFNGCVRKNGNPEHLSWNAHPSCKDRRLKNIDPE